MPERNLRRCTLRCGMQASCDEEVVVAAEVQMEAGWVETRARLTLGTDAEAATVAKEVGAL